MKIAIFWVFIGGFAAGCSTTSKQSPEEIARIETLKCIENLLQYEVTAIDAYKICKDLGLKKSKILR